jgi:osmotically-inducible protein OsmY
MTSPNRTPTHPSRRVLTALAAAALAALIAGCAGTPTQESTGEYLDNSVITVKVRTALLNAEDLPSGEIAVASFKGKVQLSGFVPTADDRRKAELVARDVPGVKSVTNGIEVKGR